MNMKSLLLKCLLLLCIILSFFYYRLPTSKTQYKIHQAKSIKDETTTIKVSIQNEVQTLTMNDYLIGVICGEIPMTFHLEAMKAQVVASRTFAYSRLLSVDNTTNSQVYKTPEQVKASWGNHYDEYMNKVKSAILQTQDQVIQYDNHCISALFYSSSCGHTNNVEDYFSGGPSPYLKSVDSPYDQNNDPHFQRVQTFNENQLKIKLALPSLTLGEISRYQSGYVKTITISSRVFTGRYIREKLGLASSCFQVKKSGNQYSFTTYGSGHGIGLSQYGAQGMALKGYDYQKILHHYYTNIKINKI